MKEIFRENEEVYRNEMQLAGFIIKKNRHRMIPPYDWYGPDPEPHQAGEGCNCPGCKARRGE